MSQEKPKVLGLVVHLPIDLAIEIFRESGDLPISEFPAILKFADSIAEVLDMEQNENSAYAGPTFMSKTDEKISVST